MALTISIGEALHGRKMQNKSKSHKLDSTCSHRRAKNFPGKWINILTVLWGLILAILKTSSNDSSNGLQITGVLGSTELSLGSLIYSFVPEIILDLGTPNSVSSSSTGTFSLLVGFRVSKHIILSKQSSNPSLLSTLAVWALSEFVKTWTRRRYISMRRKLHGKLLPNIPNPKTPTLKSTLNV